MATFTRHSKLEIDQANAWLIGEPVSYGFWGAGRISGGVEVVGVGGDAERLRRSSTDDVVLMDREYLKWSNPQPVYVRNCPHCHDTFADTIRIGHTVHQGYMHGTVTEPQLRDDGLVRWLQRLPAEEQPSALARLLQLEELQQVIAGAIVELSSVDYLARESPVVEAINNWILSAKATEVYREELQYLIEQPENNVEEFFAFVSADPIETQFRVLADQWRTETGGFSFDYQREQHPAYDQIVRLGENAIPWILRELRDRPYHWFSVLETLTGDNPINSEAEGNFQRMVDAWVDWGEKKGYIVR